jgi:glycosyltransferase involved in cell wall biosynthesis
MKICLVAPGIMIVPPDGWGAVEILIWDYFNELLKQGHDVNIVNKLRTNSHEQRNINSPYCQELIKEINDGNYDFVHVHYDCLFNILPHLTCKKIGITSHYPYIDQPEKHKNDGYTGIFNFMVQNNNLFTIFALSKKDYNTFEKSAVNKQNLLLMYNGANMNEIHIISTDLKKFKNKTMYLGKIEERKKQYLYKDIPNIHFYGRCNDEKFKQLTQYKGEPDRTTLLDCLSNYGNMLLLSTGENGTPLVLKEALMAGLPIVINKYSCDDLDLSLPFIDVIPHDKLSDIPYINNIVNINRNKQHLSNEIRDYAIQHFSWNILVQKYVTNIMNI